MIPLSCFLFGYAKRRKPSGKRILWGNHRLTSDGVFTYSERGNDDLHQNMKARSGKRILRENLRLTSELRFGAKKGLPI